MRTPEPMDHLPSVAADAALAARTQEIYERQAARFDAERPKTLFEKEWLDRFLTLVAPGGRILDLGCGSGDPIAAYFLDRGFDVIGVDTSDAMLAMARARLPSGDWRLGDMRALDLPESFDGIVAWDSFFHLMPDEQRSVLRAIGGRMNAGAALLLTVGPQAGEVAGWVGGEPIYHASLASSEYEALLNGQGIEVLEFVRDDSSCGHHTVLLARRAPRGA